MHFSYHKWISVNFYVYKTQFFLVSYHSFSSLFISTSFTLTQLLLLLLSHHCYCYYCHTTVIAITVTPLLLLLLSHHCYCYYCHTTVIATTVTLLTVAAGMGLVASGELWHSRSMLKYGELLDAISSCSAFHQNL